MPQVKAPRLLGDVGVHELHESCELVGARRRQKKMCVRSNDDEGVDGHFVEVLGLADHAENESVSSGEGLRSNLP